MVLAVQRKAQQDGEGDSASGAAGRWAKPNNGARSRMSSSGDMPMGGGGNTMVVGVIGSEVAGTRGKSHQFRYYDKSSAGGHAGNGVAAGSSHRGGGARGPVQRRGSGCRRSGSRSALEGPEVYLRGPG